MSKSIEDRIKYLEHCANLYETSGNSPLTDKEYDVEYSECQKLIPDHPFFSKVGGIDDEHAYGTPFTHKYMMGSLNKSPNTDDFEQWLTKTYPKLDNLVALLDLKVDGLSLCCHYQDGKLVRVVTRGNGVIGFDVTPNALHIKGVQKSIKASGYVEVKGEGYKDRADFYSKWAGEYENPRNFAQGAVNQKDPNITKDRGISFISYEVRGKDFKTETEKVKFLIDNGFETLRKYIVRITGKGRTHKEIANAIKKYMDKVDRVKLPFDVDGVVFKLDDIDTAESMGSTDSEGKRPKANRAIKFPTEQKETTLLGIEQSVGRTGSICPVGLLDPIRLAGTTVKRVSIHNYKEIGRLGITRLGAKVLVEKAGDIIPKIVKMISDGKGELIKPPDFCPMCESETEWDDTNTTKWCRNESCPSQVIARIDHWFKVLDIKGIGEGIISRLTGELKNSYDNPMVTNISDMYGLSHYKSELSDAFGDRAFEKIEESIASVNEVTLPKFIEALGIGKIGSMAKDIVEVAPTIEDVDKLTVEDIVKIDRFAETKARSFIDGWKTQRKEITKLLKNISIKENKLASNKLSGKKFCFTGSFSNPTRGEMEKMVEDNGGKNSSVSKHLTALVWDGEIQGGKMEKAKGLRISIITQNEFLAMLK